MPHTPVTSGATLPGSKRPASYPPCPKYRQGQGCQEGIEWQQLPAAGLT
jgi:hypothetical protein